MHISIAAFFIIAPDWNELKCLIIHLVIGKFWWIYKMAFYLPITKDMLTWLRQQQEWSQRYTKQESRPQRRHCIWSHLCKFLYNYGIQTTDRKQPWLPGAWDGEDSANAQEGTFQGWWKHSISGSRWWSHGCILVDTHQIVYFKCIHLLHVNYTMKLIKKNSNICLGIQMF